MDYFHYNRARSLTVASLGTRGLSKSILAIGDLIDTGRLADILEFSLHEVDTAHNGPEAIRKIISRDFDVVVFHMAAREIPVQMFYLALQRIRPHLCEHLILITHAGIAMRLSNFAHEHAGAVLCEPFAEEDLLQAISSLPGNETITVRWQQGGA